MIQIHTYVSVHCDQCGEALGSPAYEEHFTTEDAALDAAAAEDWLVNPGGRLWCSACGPVLTCEAEGHDFSQWRHPVIPDGRLALSEYRHCRRCCLHESRPAGWLIGSNPRQVTSAGVAQVTARPVATDTDAAGEVA